MMESFNDRLELGFLILSLDGDEEEEAEEEQAGEPEDTPIVEE